jgi:phytoene dehydrogenase-like protein
MTLPNSKSIIIIGAGIAGLSAGIYAQKNGYSSQIFEMHTQPGGLMTGWKRKGYTIDGCIHWLTGSGKKSSNYQDWRDLGILADDTRVLDPEIFSRFISTDGKKVDWYSDIDKFEEELLRVGPEDYQAIHSFFADARKIRGLSLPNASDGFSLKLLWEGIKGLPKLVAALPVLKKWGPMDMAAFSKSFKSPEIRDLFSEMWPPEMSAMAILFVISLLTDNLAGFPIGGSIPMAERVEKRYIDLGGKIQYHSRVEKILVENGRAVGIRLTDGDEFRADNVISAADGHATIFDMLEGRYIDQTLKDVYDQYKPFPPIIMVGLGVNRTFPDVPAITGGISMGLKQPIQIGNEAVTHLDCMIYNFDPTMAPEGKTVVTAIIPTNYTYWKELSGEPERYKAEKERIGIEVMNRFNEFYPGFAAQMEMADVATPMTFEHYTGNWQASFEGFLPTPTAMMKSIPKVLPGLQNFYMAGQWVQAGGGLPSGQMTAKEVLKLICIRDGKKYI